MLNRVTNGVIEALGADNLVDVVLDAMLPQTRIQDDPGILVDEPLIDDPLVESSLVDDGSRRGAAWIVDPQFDEATQLVDAACIEPLEFAEGTRPNVGIAYIFDAPFGQDASSDETPLVDVRVLADALASWKHLRRT